MEHVYADRDSARPLYAMILPFLSPDALISLNNFNSPKEKALQLWAELQIETRDSTRLETFQSTLSRIQLVSWKLLDDWWTSRYHHRVFNGDFATLTGLMEVEEKKREELGLEHAAAKTYQGCLCHMFAHEITWWLHLSSLELPADQPRVRQIFAQLRDRVMEERERALKHATWQRIAYSSYQSLRSPEKIYRDQSAMSSTLRPCPWLESSGEQKTRMPLFLWDRESQCTVEVATIQAQKPEYYCISHTWGRWRRKEVQIPGVTGWKVPTNTRFDVSSLPETFRLLQWPVRYIWFDLFCIPQDDCPARSEEIGKQADIFRNASCCVVWMNDVHGWEGLQAAVTWLSLNYLKNTVSEDLELTSEEIMRCVKDFSTPQEVSGDPFAPRAIGNTGATEGGAEHPTPDPGADWFSSLWTLQEAYLCPSALLASRSWRTLTTSTGVPLTLDNVTSLAYSPASDMAEAMERPAVVDLLLFLVKRWELSPLTLPSRMSLLIAGESRISTGPRAESIMSAMGVTDWFETYRKTHGKPHPQDELVFGLYPLEFLTEAASKIGGPFYLSFRYPRNSVVDAEAGKPLGSMLPLSFSPQTWQTVQSVNFQTENWYMPMCDSWIIHEDGSVSIKEAAIIAGADDAIFETTDGPIQIPTRNGPSHYESFHTWLETLPEVPYRFAVAVVRYGPRQMGITLEGVSSPSDPTKLILVKTGVFITKDRWCLPDLIKLSAVDWHVI